MSSSPLSRRGTCAVLIALTISSCTTMREVPRAELAARPERKGVAIETRDGLFYQFDYATFEGDTMSGYRERADLEGPFGDVVDTALHAHLAGAALPGFARTVDHGVRVELVGRTAQGACGVALGEGAESAAVLADVRVVDVAVDDVGDTLADALGTQPVGSGEHGMQVRPPRIEQPHDLLFRQPVAAGCPLQLLADLGSATSGNRSRRTQADAAAGGSTPMPACQSSSCARPNASAQFNTAACNDGSTQRCSDCTKAALELLRAFRKELTAKRAAKDFETTMTELAAQPVLAFEITLEWISALNPNVGRGVLIETAAMVVTNDQPPAATPTEPVSRATISGLTGTHGRNSDSKLELDYHEFMARMQATKARWCRRFRRFSGSSMS